MASLIGSNNKNYSSYVDAYNKAAASNTGNSLGNNQTASASKKEAASDIVPNGAAQTASNTLTNTKSTPSNNYSANAATPASILSNAGNTLSTNGTTPASAATTAQAATPQTAATQASATQAANQTTTQTTTTSGGYTPNPYTPTGIYDPNNLAAYNQQREADIRDLYAQAQANTLAGLKTAYDQNLADANFAKDQISPQYQERMNAISAEYERQRRNNNIQASANGLNTGAGSQMALAQSANYQSNQAAMSKAEMDAVDAANKRINDLKTNYQNAIAEATANNNYKLAAAMLDQYEKAYDRQMQIENANYTRAWNQDERDYTRSLNEAKTKAQYGDFSGYEALYGADTANQMKQLWAAQNPTLAAAISSGSTSGDSTTSYPEGSYTDSYGIVHLPNGNIVYAGREYGKAGKRAEELSDYDLNLKLVYQAAQNAMDGKNNTIEWARFRGGGRGYSASRDRAYRGPSGYLNDNGEYVVPGTSYGAYENLTAANGYDDAASSAYDRIGVDYSPTLTWSEQLAKNWAGK